MKKCLFCIFLILAFSGCNPTSSLKPEIEEFKKNYPAQIVSYQSVHRKMNYAWSGDEQKRPLLFVHGSPGSWEGWVHFLNDRELQKKFHIIAIDRPGFGDSTEGLAERSLHRQAEDIVEVLKKNRSHLPAILVGHSYGGPVVAKLAMDYPDQVAGVVFVASSVSPRFEKTVWYQHTATWWPFRVLIPNALRVCNEEIMALKPELEAMLPNWPKVTAHIAIVQGDADDLVPPANADFLKANLATNVIVSDVRVAGLNHFVPWKRPDLIFEAIAAVDRSLSNAARH